MIKPIMKDPIFLAQKSAEAAPADAPIAADLLDTLRAHADGCVGMAANMIGTAKRIIAFDNNGQYMMMYNPVIVKCSGPYEAEEGQYQNEQFQTRLKTFTGWTAQIIQHEIDHCSGILI